jgi:hypothetical protein
VHELARLSGSSTTMRTMALSVVSSTVIAMTWTLWLCKSAIRSLSRPTWL